EPVYRNLEQRRGPNGGTVPAARTGRADQHTISTDRFIALAAANESLLLRVVCTLHLGVGRWALGLGNRPRRARPRSRMHRWTVTAGESRTGKWLYPRFGFSPRAGGGGISSRLCGSSVRRSFRPAIIEVRQSASCLPVTRSLPDLSRIEVP